MLITLNEAPQGQYAAHTVGHADTFGAPCLHHLRNGVFNFLLSERQDVEFNRKLARRLEQRKPPQRAPLFRLHARHSKARFGFRERAFNVRGERMEIMKAFDKGLDERRPGRAVMLATGAF